MAAQWDWKPSTVEKQQMEANSKISTDFIKGSVSRDFSGTFLACMDRSTVGLHKTL
jgi:hypothetical protein